MITQPIKSRRKIIAPSILSADFANLQSEISDVVAHGADWIHVDVMDGHFVPNLTVGVPVVKSIKRVTTVPLDVHLMIEHPEQFVAAFAKAGANYITIHIEATTQPDKVLQQIRRAGCLAGISLRPATDVQLLKPYLALLDLILVMTVEPGFGGQQFQHSQLNKLKIIREWLDKNNSGTLLEVDGGINAETAKLCEAADVLVAGNYIFNNDRSYAIQTLKGIA